MPDEDVPKYAAWKSTIEREAPFVGDLTRTVTEEPVRAFEKGRE